MCANSDADGTMHSQKGRRSPLTFRGISSKNTIEGAIIDTEKKTVETCSAKLFGKRTEKSIMLEIAASPRYEDRRNSSAPVETALLVDASLQFSDLYCVH